MGASLGCGRARAQYFRAAERFVSAGAELTLARMKTRHCHQCGWVWDLNTNPGRGELCDGCSADLRVCVNCQYYDPQVAHQCRERRAEPVHEKTAANFCEWFEFVPREWKEKSDAKSKEDEAREKLRNLLGE